MKRLKKFIIVLGVLFIASMTITPIDAITQNRQIPIYDSNTNEPITNADVEILVVSKNVKLEKVSDENGFIELTSEEYNSINDLGLYIFVQKGFYKGEVSTNLDGNIITVNQTSIVTDNGTSVYGATDWNTISSSFDKYIWVPLYRIPTYGGLTATVKFSREYSVGWDISGGGLLSSSYSTVRIDDDEYISELTDNKGKYWLQVIAKTKQYKVVQQNTIGQTRTVYIVDNKIYELDGYTAVASFGTPSSVIRTISIGNTGYLASFGVASTVSFSLSATYSGASSSITGALTVSNTSAVIRTYRSTGTYYYEIGKTAIARYTSNQS